MAPGRTGPGERDAAARLPDDPGGDTAAQSRFSALRQFQVLACEVKAGVDCTQLALQRGFTSPADAFPSVAPRPRAPELIMRSFDIPKTKATHLRLEVLTNQCTGAPDYQGEQDDDPLNVTDCEDGSPRTTTSARPSSRSSGSSSQMAGRAPPGRPSQSSVQVSQRHDSG